MLFRSALFDADALNLLSGSGETRLPANAVITPHAGEAARLLGISAAQVVEEPESALVLLHERCGCHVLLKGARSLMTDGTRCAVNLYGTPALAKGGSGDILTGILAALLAQSQKSLEADELIRLQAAAALHGLAGLRAEKAAGENGVTAEELISGIRLGSSAL